MDSKTYSAFGDELVKIAAGPGVISRVGKTGGKWVSKGWDDMGEGGARGGWFGALKNKKGKPTAIRRHLPIGGKSLMVGLSVPAIPGLLAKQDPMGMGRSRTERVSGYGGMMLGGLAGAGALLSAPGRGLPIIGSRAIRSIGGAIAGGLLGEKVSTLPWQRSRQAAAQPPIQDPARRDALLQRAAAMQTLQQGR